MNEGLGTILFGSLVMGILFRRFVWVRIIPPLTHTESAPRFFASKITGRVLGFLDVMLTPNWLIKEWGAQDCYSSIELNNRDTLKKIFIQVSLDDYLKRFHAAGNLADMILCRNEIVGLITTDKKVYCLSRFRNAVEKVTNASAATVN